MKKKTKIIAIVAVVLLVVLIVAANMWRGQSRVRSVRVNIDYSGCDTLVTEEQVVELILAAMPTITTHELRDVDLQEVERVAATSPYLHQPDASTTIGGDVIVYAEQRRPIVRVCTPRGQCYYDTDHQPLPLGKVGNSDVIVANGNLRQKSKLGEVLSLASYLDGHRDIGILFDQIYCDDQGDLFLTPKLGNHIVQVGDTSNLDQKFHNLLAMYTRGLPLMGWDTYSIISLKYRGQVVCTRK